MSKKNNRKAAKSSRSPATAKITGQFEGNISAMGELHIGPRANCKASIRANQVRIDGSFNGQIAAQKNMSISPGASAKGSFQANTLKVDGTMEGQAFVRDRMDLSPTAQMKGHVIASRFVVADGASFDGHVAMQSLEQLRDMRKWSNYAKTADWNFTPAP